MANLPPAYGESDYGAVPSYSNAVGVPDQWRIVTSLEQGRRSTSVAPIQEATPANTSNMNGVGLSSYKVSLNHALQLQVRGFYPNDQRGDCFEGPAGISASRQTVIANTELSANNTSFGDIAFVEPGRNENVFIDAQDIFNSATLNDFLGSQQLRAYLTYHEGSQKEALPISWLVEPKKVNENDAQTSYQPVHEEKKHFWEIGSHKHKEKDTPSGPTLQRQKAMLNSTFRLCDDNGNVYATFESDLYSKTPTPLPRGFERVSATHRSWGTMSVQHSDLRSLHSRVPFFDKWSYEKLERLVLVSLVSILEIVLRNQGGSEGKAFGSALTMATATGSVFGAGGFTSVANSAFGGIGRGGFSLSSMG